MVAIFLASCLPAPGAIAAEANSFEDAAKQLAERVASIANLHGPVRLEFHEDSGFAADTGKVWQESFRKELEKHHLNLTDEPGAPLLRIGVTKTPTRWILAATVRVVDRDEVRLVSLPRATLRPADLPVSPVRIERQLVFESLERILDASSLWSGAEGGMELLAFRSGELAVLRLDAAGAVKQSIPLAAAGRPLRDPQGQLNAHGNDVDVVLPGRTCTFAWASGSEVKCHPSKPVWRGTTVLTPSCDKGGWKVVTNGQDWTAPETLQVLPDGTAREGSAAILSGFSGPVLSVNGEQSPASALVVSRNLRSGNYEVDRITLVCGN